MDKARIEMMLGTLAHTRLRPGMYFSNTSPTIRTWLDGFLYAFQSLGFEIEPEFSAIWREKGWGSGSAGPIHEMQEADILMEEITSEVFAVLILALQRKYGLSAEPVLNTHAHIRSIATKTRTLLDNPLPSLSEEANKKHQETTRTRLDFELRAIEKLEREMGISSANSEDK